MSDKSAAQKAHVKPGTTFGLIAAEPDVVASLGLPEDVTFVDAADAQQVLLFVRDRAQLDAEMPAALKLAQAGAVLWVFFRKGSSASGLDMSRNDVWALAEPAGMRPLGLVSVDDTWSAFRFRRGPEATA